MYNCSMVTVTNIVPCLKKAHFCFVCLKDTISQTYTNVVNRPKFKKYIIGYTEILSSVCHPVVTAVQCGLDCSIVITVLCAQLQLQSYSVSVFFLL